MVDLSDAGIKGVGMADRTQAALRLSDLNVGDEWASPRRTITEADVVAFANLSGDHNPIHVDHDYARSTLFKQPIVHGLLGMAIASGLASTAPRVETIALLEIVEWTFKEPLFFGDTLHVVTRVVKIEPRARGRRGVVTWRRTLFNHHGAAVQEGTSQTMVRGAVDQAAD